MLRKINLDSRAVHAGSAILPRHVISNNERIHATLKDAQRHAREIVKKAQEEAEAIRNESTQSGFREGMRQSLNAIYRSFIDLDKLQSQIEKSLKTSLQDSLEKSLQQPVLDLLCRWLASCPGNSHVTTLVIPNHSRHEVRELTQLFKKEADHLPTILVGQDDSVLIECGDNIFEFSPNRIIEEIKGMSGEMLNQLQIREKFANWSNRAIQEWFKDISIDNIKTEIAN